NHASPPRTIPAIRILLRRSLLEPLLSRPKPRQPTLPCEHRRYSQPLCLTVRTPVTIVTPLVRSRCLASRSDINSHSTGITEGTQRPKPLTGNRSRHGSSLVTAVAHHFRCRRGGERPHRHSAATGQRPPGFGQSGRSADGPPLCRRCRCRSAGDPLDQTLATSSSGGSGSACRRTVHRFCRTEHELPQFASGTYRHGRLLRIADRNHDPAGI